MSKHLPYFDPYNFRLTNFLHSLLKVPHNCIPGPRTKGLLFLLSEKNIFFLEVQKSLTILLLTKENVARLLCSQNCGSNEASKMSQNNSLGSKIAKAPFDDNDEIAEF